jgi:ribonucleoside-diphosphate reductase alpha chain
LNQETAAQNRLSQDIWAAKYRYGDERSISDTWARVARAVCAADGADSDKWARKYLDLLEDFRFLPGGRILAGAGTGREVTLFNCFVMGEIQDSLEGIFDALRTGALTMQQGGGIGYDFSTLRPAGAHVAGRGTTASGPVSFMRIWDTMCATLLSTGARRGAMMATLRCDHPDIETFIEAKRDSAALRNFNLSVLISDGFMAAVRKDTDWPLVFPAAASEADEPTLWRPWSGASDPVPCRIWRTVSARDLWHKLHRAAYDVAEPGVLFIDTINRENNLGYREQISATNPCGEIPLPPNGACNLGSINLTRFVLAPFTTSARMDFAALENAVPVAVRFLDNVIDISRFPLPAQATAAKDTRRLGLGVTGLADALAMLGLHYDSDKARRFAADLMQRICCTAYQASADLAAERGGFRHYDPDSYQKSPFVQRLPRGLREAISRSGMRNSHVLAIAPAGTISLLANNVSSGIEPIFALDFDRDVLNADGSRQTYRVRDFAWELWLREHGDTGPCPQFVTADDISADAHLAMQAALQPWVDNAISKTVQVPAACDFESFTGLYDRAFNLGLKGCTVFRPNPVTSSVLSRATAHCCDIDREAD